MDEDKASGPRDDAIARSEARRVFNQWLEKKRSQGSKESKPD
jgi:hypothetical protein